MTQDRVSRGAAPAGQLSGVARRVVAISTGGSAGPTIPPAGGAEAAANDHAAVQAEEEAAAAAAAPVNGLAALAATAQAIVPPASVGRKRNRKALAPRRYALLAAECIGDIRFYLTHQAVTVGVIYAPLLSPRRQLSSTALASVCQGAPVGG